MQNLGWNCTQYNLRASSSAAQPGSSGCWGNNLEAGSCGFDIIVMAHPANILLGKASEHRAGGVEVNGFAVFALGSYAYMTAEHMHHQLAAVANAQNRYAPCCIDFRINSRRILQISTVRTAGKNNSFRIFSLNCFQAMPRRSLISSVNLTFSLISLFVFEQHFMTTFLYCINVMKFGLQLFGLFHGRD